MLQCRVICAYIPSSEEVAKKTVTSRSNCPLCSCAQTITVSPSVTTYSGCVSPTITTVAICILDNVIIWIHTLTVHMATGTFQVDNS